MAISINRVVSVTIQNETSTVETGNYDTPAVACYVTAAEASAGTWGTDLVRSYTSVADMIAGGFTANSAAVKALGAMFRQNPAPASAKVLRLTTAPALTVELTPASAVVGRAYSVELVGTTGVTGTATYTAVGGDDVAAICTGLAAAITALTSTTHIVASASSTKVTCTTATAGDHFSVAAVVPRWLNVAQTQTQANIETELDACLLANKEWYGLTLATGSSAEIVAAAHWCGVNKKQGIFTTIDSGCAAGIMATVAATTNNYVQVVYCGHGLRDQGGAAKLGYSLAHKPGSEDYEYEQLTGVQVDDLTESELDAIAGNAVLGTFGAHGGAFVTIAGANVTYGNKSAGSNFMDYTRDIDFSEARIKATVWQAFINNTKIIYSNAGIQTLVSALRSAIDQDVADGIAQSDPKPVVTYPLASQVSSVNKGARILPNLSYTYTYGTGIRAVTIQGTVVL